MGQCCSCFSRKISLNSAKSDNNFLVGSDLEDDQSDSSVFSSHSCLHCSHSLLTCTPACNNSGIIHSIHKLQGISVVYRGNGHNFHKDDNVNRSRSLCETGGDRVNH